MSTGTADQSAQTVKRTIKRASELDSRKFDAPQRKAVELPTLGEAVDRSTLKDNLVFVDRIDHSYADALAFAEEPLKILIHRGDDKIGSKVTDLVAVNGLFAEVLFEKNGWVPIGYLPKGVSFVTKRKYVERLAQTKRDEVRTNVIEHDNEDPKNFLEVSTMAVLSFTVLEDKSPRAEEWLTNLIAMRG